MKVRLMGGPAMNKRVEMDPVTFNSGRYYVSFVNPTREMWNSAAAYSPHTSLTVQQGHYKPSKNPDIWTWAGKNYAPDPWKSYERKTEKWYKDYAKLASIGTPHDIIMSMMRPKLERPKV